jgi:hypothetical protein
MIIYIGKSRFRGTHYLSLNFSKSRKYYYNSTKEGKNRALKLIYTKLNILTSFDAWLMYIIFLQGD